MMPNVSDRIGCRALVTIAAGAALFVSTESSVSSQGAPRLFPSAKRPLEANAYLAPAPSSTPWAPAGTRVAYVSTNPTGNLNVYVRPIKNGAWAGPPIAVTEKADDGKGVPGVCIEPAWTRDGKDLLLVSNRSIKDIPGVSDRNQSMLG